MSGIAALLALTVVLFRSPGKVFRTYFGFFCSLLGISLLSMIDLYFEANLPAVRPGIRHGYFFLMALDVGLLNLFLFRLYAVVFERPYVAGVGWIFPAISVVVLGIDAVFHGGARLPPFVLGYLRLAAPFLAFPIALVFLTPQRHLRRLADNDLRRYVTWAFILFGLLITLYLVRQLMGDRNEFFAVYGRTHFGFSFISANLVSLYFAVRFLAKPTAAPPLSAPGDIRLSENFIASYQLTPRESVIVGEIIAGKSNREIARTVAVTEGTVKIFVHNIYKKTGVNSRMALAALLRRKTLAD